MLAAGSIVGIVAGLLTQPFLGNVDEDIRGLVRVAMMLPGVVFTAWWLLSPRPALEQEERGLAEPTHAVDARERLQKIESTFDSAAVPAARRGSFEAVDEDSRALLQDSVRRDAGAAPSRDAAYRVGHGRRHG
jgi:hypothetical protein